VIRASASESDRNLVAVIRFSLISLALSLLALSIMGFFPSARM
jgi:hypothetical protein